MEDHVKSGKKRRRLGNCHNCSSNISSNEPAVEAKYRCPACSFESCSVKCINDHKKLKNCTGSPYQLKFEKRSEIKEETLIKDFVFLEKVNQLCDSGHRASNVLKAENQPTFKSKKRMKVLKREAYKRHIELRFMPQTMRKSICNKTYLRKRCNIESNHDIGLVPTNYPNFTIVWTVEICWSRALQEMTQMRTGLYLKVNENDTISDIINASLKKAGIQNISVDTHFNCGRYKCYLLLDTSRSESGGDAYIELQVDDSLCESLRLQTIVEHPTIAIVDQRDTWEYPYPKAVVEKINDLNENTKLVRELGNLDPSKSTSSHSSSSDSLDLSSDSSDSSSDSSSSTSSPDSEFVEDNSTDGEDKFKDPPVCQRTMTQM